MLSESPFIIVGQLLSVGFSIWARRSFQKEQFSIHAEPSNGSPLTTGPYKFVRHPMYTSALFLIWISIIGHLSILTVTIGVVVSTVISLRIITEEQLLRERFLDYNLYASKTKTIIPFLY
jgi:protein-S-isoprenylcysteine O-methyltransferase Ste14